MQPGRYLKNIPILSLTFAMVVISTLSVDAPSTGSAASRAGRNHHRLLGPGLEQQSEAVASEFFSPKVTLATTKSPLPRNGRETPHPHEGVREGFKTSGILILTRALPALHPSRVRGQGRLPLGGPETRHCLRHLPVGQHSGGFGQQLFLR